MIAGDDRTDFVARSMAADGIGDARRGSDDELVGRKHQLGREAGLRSRIGAGEKVAGGARFRRRSPRRRDGRDRFPRFGRCDQRDLMAGRKIGAEMAGRPERFAVVVAALAFDRVFAFGRPPAIEHQHARMSEKMHP